MQRSIDWCYFAQARQRVRRSAPTLVGVTAVLALQACALVELSGKMTRTTGEVMTEYSKENDSGFIGRLAGFGGRINTAVGTTVEGIGKQGKDGGESPGFIDANKAVITSAIGTVREPSPATPIKNNGLSVDSTKQAALSQSGATGVHPMLIAEMQTRLTELGYQPGSADGVMGERSVQALQKFQKNSSLAITGRLDSATTEKLRAGKKNNS